MKNAKDYIEETSPNTQRITSLAYWLTPEGMDNPIYAALLRKSIATATDEDFKEAFGGATKAEAALHLERWELCYMGQWGAPELAKAIVLSDAGRNEALALRAVSMAQEAKELPEVFTPMEGIRWAMARGYLIKRAICTWCGVVPGSYGHPHNPLSTADAPAPKVEAAQGTNPNDEDWRVQARIIADECFDKDTANGCRDSLNGYSERVMGLMQQRGITGPRGIITNSSTIKREALQSNNWWANKSK